MVLPSVHRITPATPMRKPSLQSGKGLLFCSCLSRCHQSWMGAWGSDWNIFFCCHKTSISLKSFKFLIGLDVVLGLPHNLHLLCPHGGVLQLGHDGQNILPCTGDHRGPCADPPHGVHMSKVQVMAYCHHLLQTSISRTSLLS
jgi:hypothetical protein